MLMVLCRRCCTYVAALLCHVMDDALQSNVCCCGLHHKVMDRASRAYIDRTLATTLSVTAIRLCFPMLFNDVNEAVDVACAAGHECDLATVIRL